MIEHSAIDPPEVAETAWQRLSPRNLLIDPVKTLGQFAFPAVVALVGISSGDRGMPWWAVPIVAVGAVAFGVLPWLTTFYRTTDTQFQIRSGLLNKKTKTAPLDRVRSVDLEASLLHRLVGLTKVQIGTGVDDARITLDSVTAEEAAGLRSFLLGRRASASAPTTATGAATSAGVDAAPIDVPTPEPARVLAEIDWAWLRFAPFSLARLVVVAAAVGALSQFGDQLPIADTAESTWNWVHQFALYLVIGGLLLSGLTSWVMVAVTGYIVQWWNMRLTREAGSLHLTAGLFTTRSITVEEQRVRGVQMKEPVLLRLVGGAELSTLATGVGSGGVSAILPPCPQGVARSVGADVLETPEPMTVQLIEHGPAARRRSWIRQLWGALFMTAIPLVAMIWVEVVPVWVPVVVAVVSLAFAAISAEAAYRHLGHATTPDHLVVGSGELTRVRTVLEHDGIIGWVVHQSWFQRRLALATLIATTAAGAEKVVARDIPLTAAIRLADDSTPGVLTPWLA